MECVYQPPDFIFLKISKFRRLSFRKRPHPSPCIIGWGLTIAVCGIQSRFQNRQYAICAGPSPTPRFICVGWFTKVLFCSLGGPKPGRRSEEHTSELPSLMRHSYAVYCLKKK